MFRHNSKRRPPSLNPKHELAVLLPIRPAITRASSADQKFDQLPIGRMTVFIQLGRAILEENKEEQIREYLNSLQALGLIRKNVKIEYEKNSEPD